MSSGLPDWYNFTYLDNESSALLWNDVMRILLEDYVIDADKRYLVVDGKEFACWNSLTVKGLLNIEGVINVYEE